MYFQLIAYEYVPRTLTDESLFFSLFYFSDNLWIYRLYFCSMSSADTPPSCIDRFVAAVTAEIVVARNALEEKEE